MLNEHSIAIIIDYWELPVQSLLHETIVDYIDNDPNIKTVVLSSYNCVHELTHDKSVWYTNHRALFGMGSRLRKIRELSHVHLMHMVRDKTYPPEKTHPYILHYVNHSKFQIAMHWAWQLEHYLFLNPEIKNVYVFGTAWDVCVKVRTLGYLALTEIQNINILTNVKCVQSDDKTHPNLDLDPDWVKVSEDTYQYIPNKGLTINQNSAILHT